MIHRTTPATSDLLAEWRWLLGGLPRLIAWSSAGDLFYVDDRAHVWRLDTGVGEAEVVAESTAAFEQLVSDPDMADELLLLPVVCAFEAERGPLPAGHCLGFTTLPVLGGGNGAENRYSAPITEHAALTGDLHRQIRDLPDGTAIRVEVVP